MIPVLLILVSFLTIIIAWLFRRVCKLEDNFVRLASYAIAMQEGDSSNAG